MVKAKLCMWIAVRPRESCRKPPCTHATPLESMEALYPASERWDRVQLGRDAQGIKHGVALRPDSPEQELTYGEFEIESFEDCLSQASKGLEGDIDFIDIGSGVGRLAICAALLFPEWRSCRGIEISPLLHAEAEARRIRAEEIGILNPDRVLLTCADVLNSRLEFPNTNLFFIYATAFPAPRFSEELRAPILNDQWTQAIRRIVDSSSRNHIRIATTDRSLDPNAGFRLLHVLPKVKNRETFDSALYIHDVVQPNSP